MLSFSEEPGQGSGTDEEELGGAGEEQNTAPSGIGEMKALRAAIPPGGGGDGGAR